MGCFLACFGYTMKRKHRKPANKVLKKDQRHGTYQPLDSSVSTKLDATKNSIDSDSEFIRGKPKEKSSLKIRKKVRFNLNVQTYEPIPAEDLLEIDEERVGGKNEEEETAKGSEFVESAYPSSYRYQNCLDSFEEEDEIVLDDSDWDYDEDDDGSGSDVGGAVEIADTVMSLHSSTEEERSTFGSNPNARNRSQYIYSVLNPVENINQWKAVKARARPPLNHCRKENNEFKQEPRIPFSYKPSFQSFPLTVKPKFSQSKPLLQEAAIDASLSRWLHSSHMTWVT